MKRVTSAEAARNFSRLCDEALQAPVIITRNGRERLVLLSIEEYRFLADLIENEADAFPDAPRKTSRRPGGRPSDDG